MAGPLHEQGLHEEEALLEAGHKVDYLVPGESLRLKFIFFIDQLLRLIQTRHSPHRNQFKLNDPFSFFALVSEKYFFGGIQCNIVTLTIVSLLLMGPTNVLEVQLAWLTYSPSSSLEQRSRRSPTTVF